MTDRLHQDSDMFSHAITRRPGANFASGLTTAVHETPPDFELLIDQHRAYCRALRDAGLALTELEPLEEYPDAYFVEDVAVVTPEAAVVTLPGAPTRRGEAEHIVTVLAGHREIKCIRPPGRLDGGDVLAVDGHYFIGLSARTDARGAKQLGGFLEAFGCSWSTVAVGGGLHLKSSVNTLGGRQVIVTEPFAKHPSFSTFEQIVVPAEEAYAANTLAVNGRILTPAGYPRTLEKLQALGRPVIVLEVSEVRKMDGGLTCLSLRL